MKMDHLHYLSDISCADVAHLMEKEKTYGGSWKRRGGIGAWMMLARKIDRLENILGKESFILNRSRSGMPNMTVGQYDVFAHVEADPSGADSTVLAEIRDLRRYLLLVESEMVARGVVQLDNKHHHAPEQVLAPSYLRPTASGSTGATLADLPHSAARTVPRYDNSKPATPEDGGQHASLEPWVVNIAWFVQHKIPDDIVDIFYRRLTPFVYVLEPHVPKDAVADAFYPFVGCYEYDSRCTAWIIRIADCPPDAREYFPHLADGINLHEFQQVDETLRGLYVWSESEGKFNLRDKAWAREIA